VVIYGIRYFVYEMGFCQ